jgi:hypothetical protein
MVKAGTRIDSEGLFRLLLRRTVQTLNVRAYSGKLFDDAFVAAIDVIDAVDHGFAGGD